MSARQMTSPHALTASLAALMVVQCALGLLLPGQYRDPEWIKAAWFGNDCVTLVVAVPLVVVASWLARRGSIRGLLLWFGLLGYCVYNYAYYLFGAALNAFFAIYVASFVASVITLILALSRTDVTVLAAGFQRKAPIRILSGYLIFVGLVLACVWLTMWGAYAFAGKPTPVEPEAFKLVAALDLSLIVTTFVAGGSLLWRRAAWGYVIAAIGSIQGALYLLVLSLNSFVAIHRNLVKAPGELPAWGILAALTTAAAVLLLRDVHETTQ